VPLVGEQHGQPGRFPGVRHDETRGDTGVADDRAVVVKRDNAACAVEVRPEGSETWRIGRHGGPERDAPAVIEDADVGA
jgi:hypothetical protein